MTEVKPFIKCVDYWPGRIPGECMNAYRALIGEGQITNQKIVYSRGVGTVVVSYDSNQPHEWIRQELRARAGR